MHSYPQHRGELSDDFHIPATLLSRLYPLDRRLVGLRAGLNTVDKREPSFANHPAHCLVTVLIDLSSAPAYTEIKVPFPGAGGTLD
jgi:hypothetical protein